MNKAQLMSKGLQFLNEYIQLCEKYQLMLSPITIEEQVYVKPLEQETFKLVTKEIKDFLKIWTEEINE